MEEMTMSRAHTKMCERFLALPNRMKQPVKKLIYYSPLLYGLWSSMKASSQERLIHNEQEMYLARAADESTEIIHDHHILKRAILDRLHGRGIHLLPKRKGSLHIVFALAPSNWEIHNICPELEKFGHLTRYFLDERGFADYKSPTWTTCRNRMDQDLIQFIGRLHRQQPIDVLFSGLSGWHVAAETIRQINNLGIITCAYYWDDKPSFRGQFIGGRYSGVCQLCRHYDLNLTNVPASLVKYFVESGLAIFWPEAANAQHFRPLGLPFEYDVSFIGARYGQRPVYIEHLRKNGINVETFGPDWPSGEIEPQRMVEIYAKSRINLGFSGIGHSMKEMCLKGRDFEVPMCRALYLTTFHPDLDLVFRQDKEIVTYTDKADCLGKVRFLLANPGLCNSIRLAARDRCLRYHTWEKRFEQLFRLLGILE